MPILFLIFTCFNTSAQSPSYGDSSTLKKVNGKVVNLDGESLASCIIKVETGDTLFKTENGLFEFYVCNNKAEAYLFVSEGYTPKKVLGTDLLMKPQGHLWVLQTATEGMDEVVISGTLNPVEKSKSPVAVETFKTSFFRRNASPTLFESVGMINGVRPQLNCNVCNTGDIHINGMEGPYTMILIDGMPIMSNLASVYGLVGIPTGMIDKVEVIRGPASALYGSESMGGLINIITKPAVGSPKLFAESSINHWGEWNVDLAFRNRLKKFTFLTGINYFRFSGIKDYNQDGFTDIPLQNRVSIFQKMDVMRKKSREASLALRYVFEDRWGGQLNWTPEFRGTDSIYGESIQTQRVELIGKYTLPFPGNWMLHYSYTYHKQLSVYGITPFNATQSIAFAQLFRNFKINKQQNLLTGLAFRHTLYDDNTVATRDAADSSNNPSNTPLPGLFFQYENEIRTHLKILAGYRYDYSIEHKGIHSPRLALKYDFNSKQFIRLNTGTGFRVVNLFTEDHAALTGDRKVIITEDLKPERSWSGSLNFGQKIKSKKIYTSIDATLFYTQFSNKILADYTTDPNGILYANLKGIAVSRGLSVNADMVFSYPFTLAVGLTYAEVYRQENSQRIHQWFAPKWSGNFNFGYTFIRRRIGLNLSGMLNGPMRLPVLPNDYRREYSPWYCLMNFQVNQKLKRGIEWYMGVKNLLNFVPDNPLMRPFDPFDKKANDPVNNPNGYTFDTGYNYAPLQGRRLQFGLRITVI